MFLSVHDLHRYIAEYCTTVFERMDNELAPEVLLDITDEPHERIKPEIRDEIVLYHTKPLGKNTAYYVFSLAFDANILSSYYRLDGESEDTLLEAIIEELRSYIEGTLNSYLNKTTFSEVSASDLIRRSGKRFIADLIGVGYAVSPFGALNKIAAMRYEKAYSSGFIVIPTAERYEACFQSALLRFQTAVPLTQHRHARKLLELSQNDVALLCNGEELTATVSLSDETLYKDALIVEFNSHSSWQVVCGTQKLMVVTYEDVYIPKPKISFFKFNRIFKTFNPHVENKRVGALYRLVLEATKQSKGTIIIISKNARSEAYRLRRQGFLIEPLKLTPDVMLSITSIDGAVMVDLDGVCHGIGVILDGIATEKGDPSRGARYNSVIRYVETISQNEAFSRCLSIVVSEDGDVDIV